MTEEQAERLIGAVEGIEQNLNMLENEMHELKEYISGIESDISYGVNEALNTYDYEIRAGRVVEVLRAIDEVEVKKSNGTP